LGGSADEEDSSEESEVSEDIRKTSEEAASRAISDLQPESPEATKPAAVFHTGTKRRNSAKHKRRRKRPQQ
jgi:hypothetical protein